MLELTWISFDHELNWISFDHETTRMHHKPQATRSWKRSGKGEFLISLFSSFPLLMVPNILIFWGERWGEYCFQVFYFLCRFSLKKNVQASLCSSLGLLFSSFLASFHPVPPYMPTCTMNLFCLFPFATCLIHLYCCKNDSEFKCYVWIVASGYPQERSGQLE